MGLSINPGSGLTKTDLANVLKANGANDDAKSIILFEFDACDDKDETGKSDGELNGNALNKFCKYLEDNHPVIYNFLKAFGNNSDSSESNMVTLEPEQSTGNYYAVLNEDGSTSVHFNNPNTKEVTTTNYDKDGNVIETKITQLQSGEKYTYRQKEVAESDDAFSATSKNVTWTRNDDGTLQMTTLDMIGTKKGVKLTTIYNSDKTQKISEDVINRDLGLVSTVHYDSNGKKKDMTTDLSKLSEKGSSYSKEVRIVKEMQKNGRSFSSTQVNDSQGNPILVFKNNTWYNAKGKEIDEDKATDIMEKYVNKDNVGELVNTF